MKVVTNFEDLNKKVAIVRVDFNVPISDGKINDDTRIVNAIPTLKHLIKSNCKIILVSHLGRPNGYDPKFSLKILVGQLHTLTNTKVIFSTNIEETRSALSQISYGEIILMENIRFYKEEMNNDIAFAQNLASLADIYINDAFSCSHRNHASIATLPSLLPSMAGISLAQEVEELGSIFNKSCGPTVAIIGGAKISTKLNLINSLANKVDYVVVGGALANNLLRARGINIGMSLFEENIEEGFYNYSNIVLPQDVVTAEEIHCENRVCDVGNVSAKEKIFDIGPKTIRQIKHILNSCSTVLWNGPLGLFEVKKFSNGTEEIAKTIADLTKRKKIRSIVGGGDSVFAINKFGIKKNAFTYLSTAGGAFLEWITKRELSNLNMLKI